MANPEHLEILRQGVEAWNSWRRENPNLIPNLDRAQLNDWKLGGADLHGAYLNAADLVGAVFNNSNFTRAFLRFTIIGGADLNAVFFNGADLIGSYLRGANLRGADFRGASVNYANLNRADLRGANLSGAILFDANLSSALLQDAEFATTQLSGTIFADTDLSLAKGLDSVMHQGPSTIGVDTLYKAKGRIPESFLRGCGLSDWEIESAKLYNPDLSNEEINDIQYRIHDLRVRRAFQINALFISYSHSDSPFVDLIDKHLTQEGIRFWRDIHQARAGRLEKQIDQAIHLNDVVLLVLSEHSTNSDWVEHEARKAREKEKKTGKDALCPVALDDSWKTCRWPERLREQIMEYNILDFSDWQDANEFQKLFGKLLEGLNLFYK